MCGKGRHCATSVLHTALTQNDLTSVHCEGRPAVASHLKQCGACNDASHAALLVVAGVWQFYIQAALCLCILNLIWASD